MTLLFQGLGFPPTASFHTSVFRVVREDISGHGMQHDALGKDSFHRIATIASFALGAIHSKVKRRTASGKVRVEIEEEWTDGCLIFEVHRVFGL